MATLDRIQPYVEQLFDDADVRKQLARASSNLRGAQARASKKKSTKKALKDPTLRHRVAEAVRAVFAAGVAVNEAPEKQRRRSRRRWLLVLALAGAATFLALNEEARARALELIGQAPSPEPEASA